MLEIRRELGEWDEHEEPLVQAWMREDELGRIEDQRIVEQQIEVDRPSSVRIWPHASQGGLDRLQLAE